MSFGGLAPLPLRLGRGDDAGMSAEAHARLCADLVAAYRTLPIATLTLDADNSAAPAAPTAFIANYVGRNGAGLRYAPALTVAAGGIVRIRLASSVNDFGETIELLPYVASGCAIIVRSRAPSGSWLEYPATLTYELESEDIKVSFSTNSHELLLIEIYGAASPADVASYGGDLEKHDAVNENGTTYAAQWYDYLKVAQGSAYSTSDSSYRAWGLKAEARALGTSQRHTEMLAASASPGSADAKLAMWAIVLGVQQAGRAKPAVREECESRGRVAEAPTTSYLTAAISDILGRKATLTGIAHPTGTMSAWPDATFWPGIINGPGALDMGDGVWSSSRCRVTLQVAPANGYSDAAVTDLMTRDIAVFMNRTLPAADDWTWDLAAGAGFELDTSPLDLTAL